MTSGWARIGQSGRKSEIGSRAQAARVWRSGSAPLGSTSCDTMLAFLTKTVPDFITSCNQEGHAEMVSSKEAERSKRMTSRGNEGWRGGWQAGLRRGGGGMRLLKALARRVSASNVLSSAARVRSPLCCSSREARWPHFRVMPNTTAFFQHRQPTCSAA